MKSFLKQINVHKEIHFYIIKMFFFPAATSSFLCRLMKEVEMDSQDQENFYKMLFLYNILCFDNFFSEKSYNDLDEYLTFFYIFFCDHLLESFQETLLILPDLEQSDLGQQICTYSMTPSWRSHISASYLLVCWSYIYLFDLRLGFINPSLS